MSDKSQSLSLALALPNLWGEKTLRVAVNTLGKAAQAFRQVDNTLLVRVALLPAGAVLGTLPTICRALYESTGEGARSKSPDFVAQGELSTDSQVVLLIYQLVNYYGPQLVLAALSLVKAPPAPSAAPGTAASVAQAPLATPPNASPPPTPTV